MDIATKFESPWRIEPILRIRVTLAMEAGISDHVWSLEEIVGLLK